MAKTRTNIEIEDDHVQRIMTRYRCKTKTEAVDLALRHLAGQPMTLDEALAMEGTMPDFEAAADSPVPA